MIFFSISSETLQSKKQENKKRVYIEYIREQYIANTFVFYSLADKNEITQE